jgi:hypothetical protein
MTSLALVASALARSSSARRRSGSSLTGTISEGPAPRGWAAAAPTQGFDVVASFCLSGQLLDQVFGDRNTRDVL